MKTKEIYENTVSGAIASVAMPLGQTQKRAGSLFKGKKTKKKFYEGKMKDLDLDLRNTTDGLNDKEFKKKYGKSKDEMRKSLKSKPEPVKEEEIKEQDLIVVPGMRKSKDSSFIPHEKDRRDHEVEMARKDLYAAAKDAMRIMKQIQHRTEDEGLMGWQQSYITLASDYLNSVADSLENVPGTNEMTGGVIAGGMSNFEESFENEPPPKEGSLEYRALKRMKGPTQEDALEALVIEIGLDRFKRENKLYREYVPALVHHYKKQGMKEGRYYDPMGDERREQQAMDDERRYFKRREMDAELGHEKNNYAVAIDGRQWKVFGDRQQAENIARSLRRKGKKAEVYVTGASVSEAKAHKCPECGGELVSEELMNEKKDACYYKVKSRYKVWPSAYASGALVKCRKKGSKNWGNKSK